MTMFTGGLPGVFIQEIMTPQQGRDAERDNNREHVPYRPTQQGAQSHPISTVTIEFNVILSSRYLEAEPDLVKRRPLPVIVVHLKLDTKCKIPLTKIIPIEKKYVLLKGHAFVPEYDLNSNGFISYSYRVDGIREAMPNSTNEYRQLDVRKWKNNIDEDGILRQYDFVIHKDKEEYSANLKVKSLISKEKIPKVVVDAQFVMLTYLPPWEGFCPSGEKDMSSTEAVNRVRHIWRCLDTPTTFHTNTINVSILNRTLDLKPTGFNLNEVLVFFLSEKIKSYRNPDDMDFKEREKQLVSAVTITQLVIKYRLRLSTKLQRKLCLGLKFPVNSPAQKSLGLLQRLRDDIM
ncbi:uncharacterized protein [Amphiura filiformis]|uniref:uncharacterized protein n=1 Tax=Amphiura filiformis TaxID=82378 RepID=UPI003B20D3FB